MPKDTQFYGEVALNKAYKAAHDAMEHLAEKEHPNAYSQGALKTARKFITQEKLFACLNGNSSVSSDEIRTAIQLYYENRPDHNESDDILAAPLVHRWVTEYAYEIAKHDPPMTEEFIGQRFIGQRFYEPQQGAA